MRFHVHSEHEREILSYFKYSKQTWQEKNETHIMSTTHLQYLADFEIM